MVSRVKQGPDQKCPRLLTITHDRVASCRDTSLESRTLQRTRTAGAGVPRREPLHCGNLTNSPCHAPFQMRLAGVRTPLRGRGRRCILASQSHRVLPALRSHPPPIGRPNSLTSRRPGCHPWPSLRFRVSVCATPRIRLASRACHPIDCCTVRIPNTVLYKPPCVRPRPLPHLISFPSLPQCSRFP